jgi:hypothetical protein
MWKGLSVFSPRILYRAILCFALFVIFVATAWLWQRTPQRLASISMPAAYEPPRPVAHPIDYLMKKAYGTHRTILEKQTNDIKSASAAYRNRRGRHPPPGFDKWFQYAKDRNAIIIEDYFDQIYHDLNPFWGIEAKEIRQQAKNFEYVISVRNGLEDRQGEGMDEPLVRLGNEHSRVATRC